MANIQYVDELVKEYLLFRGFSQTLKVFDNELKTDKEKGFRVRITFTNAQFQLIKNNGIVKNIFQG